MTHPQVLLKPCPFCGGEAVAGSNFDNDHYVMCGADCDRCGGMVGYMKTEMAAIENWNRRTALASGSGDHAELARLARKAREQMTCEATTDALCDGVDALLAENAALRENEKTALKECSEWARKAGEAIGKLETSEAAGIVEGWQDRATEAERKLAEAEDESSRWAFRFAEVREAAGIGVKPMLSEVPGELLKMRERLDEAVWHVTRLADWIEHEVGAELPYSEGEEDARTFLSKEAERG